MRNVLVLLLALALSGCASTELVVLLPDEDGKVGALDVTTDGNTVELASALSAARAGSGGVEGTKVTDADVQANFSGALSAVPPAPKSYVLYFREGSTRLDGKKSEERLEAMLADVRSRDAVDIQVTGHTDRVGKVADNDALSLRRAQRVLTDLLKLDGISESMIRAVGRGEREPAKPTADEVAEPVNRRVEIIVR